MRNPNRSYLTTVLGDSLPMLFQRYLPQYPILGDRTFILIFVGIACVSLI